jgi:outer membrane protein OmpA-like peptidoglycan-associated protein
MPFTEAQYNDLKNKVAALERENAELKNKIANLENQLAPFKNLVDGQTYLFKNGRFTAVEAKVASPATVYFDLGSAKISDREKAHLEFFANNAIEAGTKLLLTGSADKQTGTAKGNQKLSEQRVDAVKALLGKLGANTDNIDTVAKGDTDNKFDTPAKNRCVVIEVK